MDSGQYELTASDREGNAITTNSLGRYFISYRRSPARIGGTEEARLLLDALRDHGLPTWRDLDDLASEPTEDEIVKVLKDHNTAGAILLISPEVESSPIIRNVEAYRIFQRHQERDGFLVKPVLLDLDYAQADLVLGSPAGFQKLGDWNLHKSDGDGLTQKAAQIVACDVLNARLAAAAAAGVGAPLSVALFSRRDSDPGPYLLRWDYSPYYKGREGMAGTFERIESALVDSAGALAAAFSDLRLEVTGVASLPLGVLFGAVFSPLAGFDVTWLQGFSGQEKERWSLASGQQDVEIKTSISNSDPNSEDLVLAMGVSANIEKAVTEYLDVAGIQRRSAVHVSLKGGSVSQGRRLSASEGLTIVLQSVEAIRYLKDDLGMARARIHLFLACPLSMAVLIGHKLNTFSECLLYEHNPTTSPSYHHVHTFMPSNFTYHA